MKHHWMRAWTFALALGIAMMPLPTLAASPTGLWLTGAGDAKIRISKCGRGICGSVVWLKEPMDSKTGKRQVDDNNANPRLRNRPIIGLRILNMPKQSGPDSWSGTIYNADDGKTYQGGVTSQESATLTVRGCVSVFCGSETWTRAGAQ